MSRKILVIEDNEQNMYLMKFLLEKHGLEVETAETGRLGVEKANADPPLAILLDIQLPEMDGYAVAGALRRNPALKDVPIIAVTSYAMPGDRERVLDAGATDYIEKPIDPDTFMTRIGKYLLGGTSPARGE